MITAGHNVITLGPDNPEANDRSGSNIHPLVQMLNGPRSTSVGAKFKSLSSRPLDMFWEDGKNGVPQGRLQPGKETTTNTYHGHVFYFTEVNKKSNEVARVHIFLNQVDCSTFYTFSISRLTIQITSPRT